MIMRVIIPMIVIVAWLLSLQFIMIIDVWDETHFLVYFYTQDNTLWEWLTQIWTQPIGNLYRPIPFSFASIILEPQTFTPQAWQLLRAANVLLLIGSLLAFLYVFWRWQVKAILFPIFSILFLFSGSSFISATWFANIFDVSSLFLFSCGLLLLSHQLFIIAGILMGLSFFCKEISLLFIVFLIILFFNKKLDLNALLKVGAPILILGGGYWILRLNIADYSTQHDIYNFSWVIYSKSLFGFIESFWRQTMQYTLSHSIGFISVGLSILAFKTYLNRILFIGFMLLTGLIYWSMFDVYQYEMIHYLHFIGRLYLIPVTLFLIALVLWARPIVLILLAIPILWGGWQTYAAHQQFQTVFHQIEQLSQHHQARLLIHFPNQNQINDPIRGIYIGDYPQALYKIDAKQGKLVRQ